MHTKDIAIPILCQIIRKQYAASTRKHWKQEYHELEYYFYTDARSSSETFPFTIPILRERTDRDIASRLRDSFENAKW